ncbi:MAG: ABC transporter ATP-binding protein [candidate division Zixibacteria bacterium]|nr:ABC transporter ATP-binding protein [candidate division Zixibacteria bacterium]
MMTQQNILSAENIIKRYVSGCESLEVLKSVSITLDAGDMAVLQGASGTGKSTLLHILGTLDKPESGRILYRGVDIGTLNPKELSRFRNKKIGFVYQFHHLLPEFNALENVMMPGLISGLKKNAVKNRALGLLKDVGLSDRTTHFPNQLSGGEAQRVAVARALFNKPEVVYADEPTGNLDIKTGISLMNLFEKLNKDINQTFLIATHNTQLAERIDKKLKIENGVIKTITMD